MKTKKETVILPVAKFTEFTTKSNWVNGECGDYIFEAKLFDTGSPFGINNGRVSKLFIRTKKEAKLVQFPFVSASVVEYDRGWGTRPNKEIKPVYNAIMKLLEASPKRFE